MTMVPNAPAQAGVSQPWNRIVWPSQVDPRVTPGAAADYLWTMDIPGSMRIPAVSRATALYTGLIKQCPLDAYRGIDPLPRPRLLERPDPDASRSWFVQVQVEDYLWHGNALHLVTERNAEGWPASVVWVPAAWCSVIWHDGAPNEYMVGGRTLPASDVVHIRRGADRTNPGRGIGVIEQHLATMARVAMEEDYERNSLSASGVPSVVIVTPNPLLGVPEAEDAKAKWLELYGGATREPAVLPAGTVVTPLGWSPADSQMVEARRLSLLDVANCYNLDGYWLGAESKGLTYKSVGPMYLALLRTSLEGVLVDLEQGWSDAWLPRGQAVQFDRLHLTRDDFATTVTTLNEAVAGGLITQEEARQYLGLAPRVGMPPTVLSPVDTEEPEEPEEEEVAV